MFYIDSYDQAISLITIDMYILMNDQYMSYTTED